MLFLNKNNYKTNLGISEKKNTEDRSYCYNRVLYFMVQIYRGRGQPCYYTFEFIQRLEFQNDSY